MAKRFDVATKQLVEMRPAEWLPFLKLPGKAAELISADLATVTTEADRVLRVSGREPYLVNIEFSSRADDIEQRLLRYHVLLRVSTGLPVVSAIVLLRRSAEKASRRLTGRLEWHGPENDLVVEFRYRVVRLWQMPPDSVLNGGLATLPLAPLTKVTRRAMPAVIRRMRERIDKEASPQEARELWVSTLVLLGLRYEPEYASELLKGVRQMQESSTYRAILAEGIAEGRAVGVAEGKAEGKAEGILAGQFTEARRILTMLGRKRLGEPTPEVRDALAAISTAEQFEELTLRITDVETWGELLATVG